MGLLTAIVVVLQALALSVKFGVFTITLVLAPIIIGAALYGVWAGAWLGFVFGLIVLFTDAGAFLAVNIPGTIIVCIAKGVLAGVAAALVYKAISDKNSFLGVLLSGVAAPVVNTGVFILGCLMFFMPTINSWNVGENGEPLFSSGFAFIIFGMVGVNFIVELVINLALSATIVQLITIAKKSGAK